MLVNRAGTKTASYKIVTRGTIFIMPCPFLLKPPENLSFLFFWIEKSNQGVFEMYQSSTEKSGFVDIYNSSELYFSSCQSAKIGFKSDQKYPSVFR
jgi:hypothetical protein